MSAPRSVTLEDRLVLVLPAFEDSAVLEPIVENRYELNELDFVRASVRAGDAVLDLGAHIGAYTLRLARLVGSKGRVTAVEPCRLHVDALRQSVAANGFDSWVHVVHAAASNVSGESWLRHGSPESSAAHSWIDASQAGAGEATRTVRMDDVIDRPLQFVKIDVEGAEGLALRGAREVLERDRPTLLVELHPHLLPVVSGETPSSLIAWVCARGYECRLLGAGRPGTEIADTPSNGVTAAVFLPK